MHLSPGTGLRLREERERSGFSQEALGRMGNVSRRTQAAYESEENYPALPYLVALDEAGIDIFYVLTGKRGENENISPDEQTVIDCMKGFSAAQRKALITIVQSMIGSGA